MGVCAGGARGPVEAGRQDIVDEYYGVHVPLEITTIARGNVQAVRACPALSILGDMYPVTVQTSLPGRRGEKNRKL